MVTYVVDDDFLVEDEDLRQEIEDCVPYGYDVDLVGSEEL